MIVDAFIAFFFAVVEFHCVAMQEETFQEQEKPTAVSQIHFQIQISSPPSTRTDGSLVLNLVGEVSIYINCNSSN